MLVLIVALACARLPFISNVLLDEEGMFAYMVVNDGDGGALTPSDSLLVGRIDRHSQFGFPSHPVVSYGVLVDAIRPLNSPANFAQLKLSDQSRIARRPFLFMFVFAMAIVFYLARWVIQARHNRVLTISLLAFGLSAPLLVGGSIQPQLDGSWGVLLCAVSVALIFAAVNEPGRRGELAAFVAGFAAAIGKNEWWLSLLGAVVAVVIARLLIRRGSAFDHGTRITALGIVGGIFAGAALSWWLDPRNFLGGFDVMRRLGAAEPSAWRVILASRWPWIWPVAALLALAAGIAGFASKEIIAASPLKLIVLFWAVALFGGFVFTSWSGDGFPRYFCPVAVVALCFLIDAFRSVRLPRLVEITLIALLLTGTVKNVRVLRDSYRRGISISSLPGSGMAQATSEYLIEYETFLKNREPAIAGAAYGYYFPTADFAIQSMGVEEARKALERWKAGKR